MNAEAEQYDLLVRLAAYSGCSLQFGIFGFVDNDIVISSVTNLHHLPPGKTLSEVADFIHNVLLHQAESSYHIPDNIEWHKRVTPGVCMN